MKRWKYQKKYKPTILVKKVLACFFKLLAKNSWRTLVSPTDKATAQPLSSAKFLTSTQIDQTVEGKQNITLGSIQGSTVHIHQHTYQLAQASRIGITQNTPNKGDKLAHDLPIWILQRVQKNIRSFFVYRQQELSQITHSLINAERKEKFDNTVALWGAGGCGKTSLALLTCCTPTINSYFRKNIFWVDLEEEIDASVGLKDLCWQSTGIELGNITSGAIVTFILSKWNDEPRLVVLDDLRQYEDLKIFLPFKGKCSFLITARNIRSFAGQEFIKALQINPLQIDEAVALIAYDFKDNEDIELEPLKELVEQLYELPFLIELIKEEIYKRIHIGHTVETAISSILEDLREDGWNFYKDISENLFNNFEASLKELSNKEKNCLETMTIFPENILIPISIMAKLCCLSESKARRLSEYFYGFAFFSHYSSSEKTICMNNIFREYLLQKDEVKNNRWKTHRSFLECYQKPFIKELPKSIFDELSYKERVYVQRFYRYHYTRATMNISGY